MCLSRYTHQGQFGEGSYGVVYRAIDALTNATVALRILTIADLEEDDIPSTLLREISILKSVNHINVVSLVDVCTTEISA